MRTCIDLCSGTGSVSRALRVAFPDARIISYDIVPDCGASAWDDPNHEFRCADVRGIDIDALRAEVGCPAFVWASPPCTQYSLARSRAKTPRDLVGADSIVAACMNIIEGLAPVLFALENPNTGLLPKRDVISRWEPMRRVTTYCSYGFDYKKETAIWTNSPAKLPRCSRADPCPASRAAGGMRHPSHAQKGPDSAPGQGTIARLHRVPEHLVLELAGAPLSFSPCDRSALS